MNDTNNNPRIVVKRHGHAQGFDEKKVYASVYSAALNSHFTEEESENLANKILEKVLEWINDKTHVSSGEIKKQIIENLNLMKEEDVAHMYESHLDIC